MTHAVAPVDLLVVAQRAILPDGARAAAIAVSGGRITGILDPTGPLPAAAERIDLAADEVLMPALVDSHVHANEPGRTHWEGLRTLTAAAAAGGIGTVVDMPLNCIPATVDVASWDAKRASCPVPSIDVAGWAGAVGGRLDDLPALLEAGTRGAKAFMIDSGVAEFPALTTDEGLAEAMEILKAHELPLLVHAEDADVAARTPVHTGTHRYGDLLASRPPLVESMAIGRLAELAERTGAHVHVVHVSSAEGVAAVEIAQRRGIHLTAETCPHYLALCAEDLPDDDPAVKCFPPIRERHHQHALWAGLANGVLSMVVTDHSPAPWTLKDTGDLATAWGGIASIQLSLPVVWSAARQREVSLTELVAWMAERPADLAGLPQKGRIAVGADADLIAFAPDATFTVRGDELLHRHPQTPYEGRLLHGVVRTTWLRGRAVDPSAPHGRWLLPDAGAPAAASTTQGTASTTTGPGAASAALEDTR
ncbi:MAG: allantoinase AllB [Solirubrobacteraceae bacterium]|nr:allantoinase AllB [Solirubrobacteraceae bacterium]